MVQGLLRTTFYTLLFLTPLFFTPYNNELFEYNKMLLAYSLTVIVSGLWVLRMVNEKRLILKRTPLDIFIVVFYISQVLSTIFSIDPHTSIWGYYSRSNGGLLSITSYLVLYYALVSNFTKEDVAPFLKAALAGGLVVSLWAIPEHFGFSPSCALLTGQFSADCWVQDVQARVFATLGQPNWLAAYLGMLIFPAVYFVLSAKTKLLTTYYLLLTTLFYLAFTFTYSRGAALGVLGGLVTFVTMNLFQGLPIQRFRNKFGMTVGAFLLINLLFGSALTGDFRLIKQSAPPPRPGIATGAAASSTQLETGGTESGQIRLIVWKGALDIFRHYPLLGSGVETFAYSYYNFRPKEHNLVSEWDFLYNKAHNEYLNYLATTGALGFGAYLLMIGAFLLWVVKYMLWSKKDHTSQDSLLIISVAAGYISYLVQNLFGFSVVMIALLFYLYPGVAFLEAETAVETKPSKNRILNLFRFIPGIIYKRAVYTKASRVLIVLITVYFLFSIITLWRADRLYKLGSNYVDAGNVGRGYNYLLNSFLLNKAEPLYQSDLGYAAAGAAVALESQDATESSRLKDEASEFTDNSLKISPNNVSLWRTAIRTYFQLSIIDQSFEDKTLEVVDRTIALAPTDPKLYYNKALILSQLGKNTEAVEVMKKAIELKPNYREAYLTLSSFYNELGEKDKAKEQAEIVLKMIPNDPDALKLMEQINNQKTQKDSVGQNF